MKTFPCLFAAALTLSACSTSGYQTVADDPPGDALAQVIADCQEQELAPEFDVIRSKVSMSVTGNVPAPFMLASAEFPTPSEGIEIARLSEIRDTCSRRVLALINTPPLGVPPPTWQQVVDITQQDGYSQHNLMMALARGEMPYGQFAVDSTRIAQRRIAAIQPFIQEAGALEQVAMAHDADQNAAATGALIGEALIDILDIAADAGASRGGYHNHHGTVARRHRPLRY
jgi:hypothetical protein